MTNHMIGKAALIIAGSWKGHVGDVVEILDDRIYAIRLSDGTVLDFAFGDFITN